MRDKFTKQWIISNALEICDRYDKGILTLRGLHYQLVSIGMTNDIRHYKKVVTAMIEARWNNLISFDTFSDLDRTMIGSTEAGLTFVSDEIDQAKIVINSWLSQYSKNRWENQPYYPEVFIEKKALQGVFEPVCRSLNVALGACKGYPSLTFLYDAYKRFKLFSHTHMPIILYFGDYDPSGEDIPRSIIDNLDKLGISVILRVVALTEDQVVSWSLPPAPVKRSDTRSSKWSGLGQVELDAVKPEILQKLCQNAILELFNEDLYLELQSIEEEERITYQNELKEYIKNMKG